MNKRIPLNPCDYCFYGLHRVLIGRGEPGNIPFMFVEVEGHPEPDDVRTALARAMQKHPALTAGLALGLASGKPYWQVRDTSRPAAEAAARKAHSFDDLRGVQGWRDRLEQLTQQRFVPPWNLRSGPQVRLEQYALPDGRTRFCLHWPHFLTDAEGAQWLLRSLSAMDEDSRPLPGADSPSGRFAMPGAGPVLLDDHETVDLLSNYSMWEKLDMFRRGFTNAPKLRSLKIQHLIPPGSANVKEHRVLSRHWSAMEVQEMQDRAREYAPPGPAVYARYVAASVTRALHRLYLERGIMTDAYILTFPLRVGASKPHLNLLERRPMPGNYLVAPSLCLLRERVDDRDALGEDIQKQYRHYHEVEGDICQWSQLWMASQLHAWVYPLIFKLPIGNDYASGFSYYGEIARPVRDICGARVTNLWGGGPSTTPPGCNPVFSRFEDRLNLTLTYSHPSMSDELARRYIELIEDEIFTAP